MIQHWEKYLSEFSTLFNEHADRANAGHMAAYMKNNFVFFGIKSPLRRELLRKLVSVHGKPSPDQLKQLFKWAWKKDQREFQYAVMDVAGAMLKKTDVSFLPLYEHLIQHKSWWDTVDWLAPKGCGTLLINQPAYIRKYPDKWISNDNIWLQRSAILYQLKFKQAIDEVKLFSYILQQSSSREFFVQKAAGWALRELSKYRPESVLKFIEMHTLPALTKREGLKWMKRKKYI